MEYHSFIFNKITFWSAFFNNDTKYILLFMVSAIGMPILKQLAASGLSEAARSSQLGSLRRLRMRELERAMMYSVLHRSFSRISHSSLHKSRGLSMPELRSHVGKAKWHKDGIANWEQRSDRWLEVPIMVNAAEKKKRTSLHTGVSLPVLNKPLWILTSYITV